MLLLLQTVIENEETIASQLQANFKERLVLDQEVLRHHVTQVHDQLAPSLEHHWIGRIILLAVVLIDEH